MERISFITIQDKTRHDKKRIQPIYTGSQFPGTVRHRNGMEQPQGHDRYPSAPYRRHRLRDGGHCRTQWFPDTYLPGREDTDSLYLQEDRHQTAPASPRLHLHLHRAAGLPPPVGCPGKQSGKARHRNHQVCQRSPGRVSLHQDSRPELRF